MDKDDRHLRRIHHAILIDSLVAEGMATVKLSIEMKYLAHSLGQSSSSEQYLE